MSGTRKTARFASPPALKRTESHLSLDSFEEVPHASQGNGEQEGGSSFPEDVGNTTTYVDPRDLPTAPQSPAADWYGPSVLAPILPPTTEQLSAHWQSLQGELAWFKERILVEERIWSTLDLSLELVRERALALAPYHKRHAELLAQLERLRFLEVSAGFYVHRGWREERSSISVLYFFNKIERYAVLFVSITQVHVQHCTLHASCLGSLSN